ncbi:MAG TPA: 1,3-beta-galactosyl-N-acetylhexosamine phosphorylase [Candidatus Limiplasma sp.]|nr:1,3-beta-galactosyl-N-acetylhexosamine phosphorylase [Candidatus Limiplasma sp.]
MNDWNSGSFTLPGEAGYEALSLALAGRWGADAIRDCDGTTLSQSILNAGFSIYSTICIIRQHNQWIQAHPNCRQQCILSTSPRVCDGERCEILLMEDFFAEQFRINASPEALKRWQVYDRTTGTLLGPDCWEYCADTGSVSIRGTAWHSYTVSFFVWRIWEEISMYNHTTNHWDQEHLMQVDPVYPEAQAYLKQWLTDWCERNPNTDIVRFTSLFYNFAWIWGSSERNQYLFTDWSSYDFTVSPRMLSAFEAEYGYAMTAEDFIKNSRRSPGHDVPSQKKRDWMAFVQRFVAGFTRELTDIVHRYGKQAYVFYDDSWIGMEPYNGEFANMRFDGLIKCVFSGFEVRLCADVPVQTHEIRLHPYLFPVGLGGAPTFMEGGDPARDAKTYWRQVRRALLRKPVDRIGLGGYLHLTEGFPEFLEAIDDITGEFRRIKTMHEGGGAYVLPCRVAVLTAWGKLRSWTLSGHFHEVADHDLIHIIECLAGLPLDVTFISFDDVKRGALQDADALICAGRRGTAWSGGELWQDVRIVEAVTAFVHAGGTFLGVNEPSAVEGYTNKLRMAQVLGINLGENSCHGKWQTAVKMPAELAKIGADVPCHPTAYLSDAATEVWLGEDDKLALARHAFGKGQGIYAGGWRYSPRSARLLLALLTGKTEHETVTDNPMVDCAWYPKPGRIALANLTSQPQRGTVTIGANRISFYLKADEMQTIEV